MLGTPSRSASREFRSVASKEAAGAGSAACARARSAGAGSNRHTESAQAAARQDGKALRGGRANRAIQVSDRHCGVGRAIPVEVGQSQGRGPTARGERSLAALEEETVVHGVEGLKRGIT